MMHSVRQLIAWLLLLPPLLQAAPSAQRPAFVQLSAQLNPQYVRAMNAYRRLERSVPRKELRALTTIGLLNGARQAEQQMEEHLVAVIKELLLHTDMQDSVSVLPKIEQIEQELVRDQRALDILSSAMDLVTSAKDVQTFRREMRNVLQQQQQTELQAQQQSADLTQAPLLSERLAMLRRHILEQVPNMKTQLDAKIEHTLEHLLDEASKDGLLAKASHKVLHKRNIMQPEELQPEEPAEIRMIKSILTEATQIRAQDDFRDNLVVQELEERIVQHKMKQREEQSKSEADNMPAGNANDFALDFDDPEEEGPVQPVIFAQNLLSSFLEAKNRPPAGDASAERHGSAELSSRHKKKEAAGAGGSDSGSFVKQIVSHLVSSALGLLLNASLGASGGASSASSGLFASSSAASQHMKPAHHKSWSPEYY